MVKESGPVPTEQAQDAKKRTFALNRVKQKIKLVATDKKLRKDAICLLRDALVRLSPP